MCLDNSFNESKRKLHSLLVYYYYLSGLAVSIRQIASGDVIITYMLSIATLCEEKWLAIVK